MANCTACPDEVSPTAAIQPGLADASGCCDICRGTDMGMRFACMASLALILSACASAPGQRLAPVAPQVIAPLPGLQCQDCGRVERVETLKGMRASATGGAVLGGVVGGVLSGRNQAKSPPPGPVTSTSRITVLMASGRRLVIHQDTIPANLRPGSVVRFSNGKVLLLR